MNLAYMFSYVLGKNIMIGTLAVANQIHSKIFYSNHYGRICTLIDICYLLKTSLGIEIIINDETGLFA